MATATPALAADWPQYHRTSARAGLGPATPAFGSPAVAWTSKVDGDVYASPLIVAGHVLVATENNTVYSIDLFSGSVVWKIHLGGQLPVLRRLTGNEQDRTERRRSSWESAARKSSLAREAFSA